MLLNDGSNSSCTSVPKIIALSYPPIVFYHELITNSALCFAAFDQYELKKALKPLVMELCKHKVSFDGQQRYYITRIESVGEPYR